jgi:hypothetical protein
MPATTPVCDSMRSQARWPCCVTCSVLASFRGACAAREPGIHTRKRRGYGFRARRIRSRVYPRSALYDAHIGSSRCAAAPRNDFRCGSIRAYSGHIEPFLRGRGQHCLGVLCGPAGHNYVVTWDGLSLTRRSGRGWGGQSRLSQLMICRSASRDFAHAVKTARSDSVGEGAGAAIPVARRVDAPLPTLQAI